MEDDLTAAKRRVSAQFLGRDKVHGVGVHPETADTIAVYRAPDAADLTALVQQLRQAAAPYAVELIHEVAPEMLGGPPPAVPPDTAPPGDEAE